MAAILSKTITTKGVKKSTISTSVADAGDNRGSLVSSVSVPTDDPNVAAHGVVWLEVRDDTDAVVVNPAGPLSNAELTTYKQLRRKIFAAGVVAAGYAGDPDVP